MENSSGLISRIETEINNYLSSTVEVSAGVSFSQYQTIKRIYKFKNRDLSGTKINADLSYDYYYDIISPRADAEVKNLRFDIKNVLLFSQNPTADFSAVFIGNLMLKKWMNENGEGMKLKASVEEFTTNGNIGFKKVDDGYEFIDPLNTYIVNQLAETIDNTSIIERHEMTASQLLKMDTWNQDKVRDVIAHLKNKTFSATELSSLISATGGMYEIYEYSGEVNEEEFLKIQGIEGGNPDEYFLAKVIVAGLNHGKTGKKYVLFAEKLSKKLSDYYLYAHRGRYEGRFWRVGMYELLFDHQIRANQIGNDLARGLEWASKVIFQTSDSQILQNIRADMDNGDVVIAKDLKQVDVRMQGLDQLITDWNRLMNDADRLSNSFEIVRGESLPSGTPFRLGALMDQNAGLIFVMLRQKITMVYKRVFKNWVLSNLIKDLKKEDLFVLTGDMDVLDQLREVMVNSWYYKNLVQIGPHTQEESKAIKEEKLEELKKTDPTIENSKEIWEGVLPRLFVTITGENSDSADQVTDLVNLIPLEIDPGRRSWMLDQIYRIRNIPIPPVQPVQQVQQGQPVQPQAGNTPTIPDRGKQPVLGQ